MKRPTSPERRAGHGAGAQVAGDARRQCDDADFRPVERRAGGAAAAEAAEARAVVERGRIAARGRDQVRGQRDGRRRCFLAKVGGRGTAGSWSP